MNKVITINLNGRAYQLEEEGYDALRAYITEAQTRLAQDPGKDEIIADLEQAIAEKCDRRLNPFKTVVSAGEIADIIKEMGPVQQGGGAAATAETQKPEARQDTTVPKRLYRIREGAMLGGVCNGVAAYFNIDVTLVRLIWVLFALFSNGTVIIVYFVMWWLVPRADTPKKEAAARGVPFTAQEVIDHAQRFVNDAAQRVSQQFSDKQKWREWKWQCKQEWKRRWKPSPPAGPLCPPVASPFWGMLFKLLALGWVLALISLIATRTIFGWAIPAGLPLWVAIICLFFIYHAVAGPFKTARYAHYRGNWYYNGWHALVDTLSTIFVIAALWWAYVNIPEVHDFINHLPAEIHQASDNIANWINHHSSISFSFEDGRGR